MTPQEMKIMDELTRICDYCGDPICVKNGAGFCSKQCEVAYYDERSREMSYQERTSNDYEPPDWYLRSE